MSPTTKRKRVRQKGIKKAEEKKKPQRFFLLFNSLPRNFLPSLRSDSSICFRMFRGNSEIIRTRLVVVDDEGRRGANTKDEEGTAA